ncbi:MAG: MBOAT family protein [Bacteroidales bacterium]|nr:MBOAT family protein [Bacteroidales bacterium]MDD5975032.1 MBOAT family protein [Bacteroidales bacterium]MDY5193551.1 MBOAT family O-acyltransferase [Candidatus Aphodosoma sp.]
MDSIINFLSRIFAFDANSPLLFTQFYFWAFFAIVFAIFSLIKSKRLLKISFLFFVSLFFYYKTSGLFVLLLLFATISDFTIAKQIYKSTKNSTRKLFASLSVVINLTVLCYFKYSYFIINIINTIFGTSLEVVDIFAEIGNVLCGYTRFSVDSIILPVGISFYTFQTISYTLDVYRKRITPIRNILDYGFYVSFFPQLVAGPIVRAAEFIPQIYKPYFLSRRQFGIAVFWIINGLAKKIILSDYLAVNFIDRIFETPLLYSGFENLMALFAYSLQVYADFSGYTDIAIGVAMLMGFYLPKNFNSPYKAPNASNFWKRWHISLSKWLQDYLYIPLGGNRNATFGTYFWIILMSLIGILLSGSWIIAAIMIGIATAITIWGLVVKEKRNKIITNLNLMVTMLLGGLWHGASLNFVIWGGLNGIGIVIYKIWRSLSMNKKFVVILLTAIILYLLTILSPLPIWNILFIWVCIITIGTFVRWIYSKTNFKNSFSNIGNIWGIFQTFVFISFTRLFFRSGSNLDPALANEQAWVTAQNMIHQIGSTWDFNIIPSIFQTYSKVFILFLVGMLIHWIPDKAKRWYRINFSLLPLPIMAIIVVLAIFIICQFLTSNLQAFIYFQF